MIQSGVFILVVTMTKILISACLLGQKVRYDGKANYINHAKLIDWQERGILIPLCPELAGGMSVPRAPCEIVSVDPLKIISNKGQDQTKYFLHGANQALELAIKHNIQIAILKQSSPSCGSQFRYDGNFSRTKIPGEGVTTMVLRKYGIKVFDETQIDEVVALITEL